MRRCALLLATLPLVAGCGKAGVDIRAAEKFERFPLYWVGRHFERWDLEAIDGLDPPLPIVTFVYGECTPHGGEQPSCTPPFQIQSSRSCRPRVFRGEGSYPGLPRNVLRAVRPINQARCAG